MSSPQEGDIKLDQDAFRSGLQILGNLLKENLDLLETFAELFRKKQSINEFFDLYEALHYELKIRCEETLTIISQLNNPTIIEKSNEIPNIITNFQKPSIQEYNIIDTQIYDLVMDLNMSSSWKLLVNNNDLKGARVAVLGLYDKGKTHILNQLTNQNLPTGSKITTKGISLKQCIIDKNNSFVLIDTAGSYAPENLKNLKEKQQIENAILEISFELTDYFICVVNDFTSIEVRYLDQLARKLSTSLKQFKEIIVIHNLKDITNPNLIQHVWSVQIEKILEGNIQKSTVEAINPFTNQLEEKSVMWFNTETSRHICIVNDNSDLGKSINPWTYSLLKYWLKLVVVPHQSKILKYNDIVEVCQLKMSNLLKKQIKLTIQDTHLPNEKRIIKQQAISPKFNSTLITPKFTSTPIDIDNEEPEEYEPQIDIIQGTQYIILIDLPGVQLEEVEIYRQNVTTIIRGHKKISLYTNKSTYLKQERKYGPFDLRFKIPDEYDPKWKYYGMNNGVLGIIYTLDSEDSILPKKNQF
ncbi:unnamed protein product [Paramecium pentaurelia]|uniref:SHSP domain-containing protein n=1 Tax=Paramecium pentaurelia TaxID=43138 RepID=A0A8S1XDR5_9CILI|nr:unnamed protein product [Paramecium pentaurelia]